MTRRPALLLSALATALVLTACGSDGGSGSDASSAATQTIEVSDDLTVAPEVPGTDAAAPTELVTEDVVVGDGPVAEVGTSVEVKYVGAFYDTGESFDSSWSRGDDETLPFTVGGGQLIEGFDTGVVGMAVGGRRVITIPSDLGYGDAANGTIPGESTLVFVVDLVSVA